MFKDAYCEAIDQLAPSMIFKKARPLAVRRSRTR